MAIIYFPKNASIIRRDTVSGSMVVESIGVSPNSIFFFDTASHLEAISSSVTDCISASYSKTASYFVGTASFATNGISASYLNAPSRITMGGSNLVGFFGATPVTIQNLTTAVGTTITASTPGTADYDISVVGVNWDSACWGVSSSNELLSCMNAIKNLQSRVTLLETALNTLGLTIYD